VNSAAHHWGYKNFEVVGDKAKNNWFVALFAFGEGWHNNHHAYGDSVKAGYRFWELDVTYLVIRFCKFLGLASDLKYVMPMINVNTRVLRSRKVKIPSSALGVSKI
jgi:stearoyl-CoA desaturase (delta-9 desaturase)